jgi:hypothetical protein
VRERHWQSDVDARQRSAVPPDAARNEAAFYAALLKPGRPLNYLQRVGGVLIAILPMILGAFCAYSSTVGTDDFKGLGAIIDRFANIAFDVVVFTIGCILLYFGLRIILNSIRAPYPK